MGIRILIADRQDMFREVLRQLLEGKNDFTVVGETGDGEQLLKLIEEHRPDVILLDPRLKKCSGLELLQQISLLDATTRPILLTDESEFNDVVALLRAGVRGMVWKNEPPAQLFKSIRAVMAGEYWVSRSGIGKLVENLRALAIQVEQNAQSRAHALSPQQQQIVEAIASGCSNKDIAKEMSISERTVKYHLTRIFSKLGVTGRTQLARFALKNNS